MAGLLEDVRHAFRLYRLTPVASLLVVVVLAVAMAFDTALLSLYVDLLLRPHPGFERGNGIVTFGWSDGQNAGGLPHDLIERIADEAVTLEAAAGTWPQQFSVGPDRELLVGEMVTADFFDGVRPRLTLGRGFERSEHGVDGDRVAVISDRYWRGEMGARADALGETITIYSASNAGAPTTTDFRIVGVMTPDFTGTLPPQTNLETDLWLPFEQGLPIFQGSPGPDAVAAMRSRITLRGIGRHAPGSSWQAIMRELNGRYLDDLPGFTGRPGLSFEVLDGLVFNAPVQRNAERQLRLMLVGGILLALVAAANVSLFLLARAPGRRRELGIRMAVGARLKRLARQLATEAGLLVVVASAVGLALSVWLSKFMLTLDFLRNAQWRNVTLLDWRVLGLAGILALALTLLVSLAPILGLKRISIAASSSQAAGRASVAQRIAGSAQIAIAGALAAAAIAFGWYLGSLIYSDPGYETRDRHAALLSLIVSGDAREFFARQETAVDNVRRREAILSLPGVVDVSIAGMAPGVQAGIARRGMPRPDDPADEMTVRTTIVDSRYVDLLGLGLLHGRALDDSDMAVGGALVNETLARQAWGRADVVGERLPLAAPDGGGIDIVGVLADVSFEHPEADIEPTVFMSGGPLTPQTIAIIESRATAGELRAQLQGLVDAGELDAAIQGVTSLNTLRRGLISGDRARGFLIIGTAALVILVAAFGFYGMQRYLVMSGRREYAVRASLGAGPRALGRLVLWRGLLLGLPGLVLSVPMALIAVALLRDDYISRDISPSAVTIGVILALTALLLVACAGPCRLAQRMQPAPVLRED